MVGSTRPCERRTRVLEKRLKTGAHPVLERLMRRGGALITAGALPPPFPFTSIVMAAGVARFPAARLLPALAITRDIRYSIAAFLGYEYAGWMLRAFRHARRESLSPWATVGGGVLLVSVVGVIWRFRVTAWHLIN